MKYDSIIAGRGLDRSADRQPLPGELQGQQPQPGEGWVKYNGLWMISRERRAALCPGKNVKCYDLQPAPAQQHHRHHNNLSSSQLRQFIIPLKSSGARRPGTANIHNKYQQKQEKSKRWRKLSEAEGERLLCFGYSDDLTLEPGEHQVGSGGNIWRCLSFTSTLIPVSETTSNPVISIHIG